MVGMYQPKTGAVALSPSDQARFQPQQQAIVMAKNRDIRASPYTPDKPPEVIGGSRNPPILRDDVAYRASSTLYAAKG